MRANNKFFNKPYTTKVYKGEPPFSGLTSTSFTAHLHIIRAHQFPPLMRCPQPKSQAHHTCVVTSGK